MLTPILELFVFDCPDPTACPYPCPVCANLGVRLIQKTCFHLPQLAADCRYHQVCSREADRDVNPLHVGFRMCSAFAILPLFLAFHSLCKYLFLSFCDVKTGSSFPDRSVVRQRGFLGPDAPMQDFESIRCWERTNISSGVRSLSWPLYTSQSGCLLR